MFNITLYGRREESPIVSGVWNDCVREGHNLKRWAKTADNPTWRAGASQMSVEHLDHVMATDVEELARENYLYLELRAKLGKPQCWDRQARERWTKLGGVV